MKISDSDRKILSHIQHDYSRSVTQVAKTIKIKENRVRHCLSSFLDKGILRRRVFVNHSRLGLREVAIYFSLKTTAELRKEAIRRLLLEDPIVFHFVELLGEFDFAVVFCAKDDLEVEQFLERLSLKSKGSIVEKKIHVRTRWYFFGVKYLAPVNVSKSMIEISPNQKHETLDELSTQILKIYSSEPTSTVSSIARDLRVPNTTVDYRLKQLISSGVIAGIVFGIDAKGLGYENFRILITAGLAGESLRSSLLQWCQHHSNVVSMVMGYGTWDFELRLETESLLKARVVCDQLIDQFELEIKKVELIPVAETHKIAAFGVNTKK